MYQPDTAILITRYLSEGGVAEVVDFMPIDDPERASDHHRLVRGIRGLRGEVTFEARVAPRFDYARQSHRIQVDGTTARFESDDLALDLRSAWPLRADGTDVVSHFTVRAGEQGAFLLESGADGAPTTMGHGELQTLFDDTANYWQRGSTRSLPGRWREAVRPAITPPMTYAPTEASSPRLPPGSRTGSGERNWDYR
jgi:hypothetical protein